MRPQEVSRLTLIILIDRLFRQLPKDYFDGEHLEYLRSFGAKGTRAGHMGRMTNFYSLVICQLFFPHLHYLTISGGAKGTFPSSRDFR